MLCHNLVFGLRNQLPPLCVGYVSYVPLLSQARRKRAPTALTQPKLLGVTKHLSKKNNSQYPRIKRVWGLHDEPGVEVRGSLVFCPVSIPPNYLCVFATLRETMLAEKGWGLSSFHSVLN